MKGAANVIKSQTGIVIEIGCKEISASNYAQAER